MDVKKGVLNLLLMASVVLASTQARADHHKSCQQHVGKHESEKHEMHADTNDDGKVSYEEFKAARIKHMDDHFKRRDTNGDGFIDAEERKAARQHHHNKHHDKKSCKRKKDER